MIDNNITNSNSSTYELDYTAYKYSDSINIIAPSELPLTDLLVIERQLRGALMMLGRLQGKTYKIIDKIEDKK